MWTDPKLKAYSHLYFTDYLGNVLEELGLSLTENLQQMSQLLRLSPEDYQNGTSGCNARVVAAVRQMRNITSSGWYHSIFFNELCRYTKNKLIVQINRNKGFKASSIHLFSLALTIFFISWNHLQNHLQSCDAKRYNYKQ